jgi:hypothetical protein
MKTTSSILLGIAGLFLAGCTTFTGDRVSTLKLGMTSAEVENVVGTPNSRDSHLDGSSNVLQFVYIDRFMSAFSPNKADYVMIFRDDHLVSFAPQNIVRMSSESVQPTPNEQASSHATYEQTIEQLQRSQAGLNAAYSQAADNMRRVNESYPTNLQMSNGFPNNQSVVKQNIQTSVTGQNSQLPSGIGGFRTGRMEMGLDGTTYYEMRDVNGVIYWSNK